MLMVGSILAGAARFARHPQWLGKLPWLLRHRTSQAPGDKTHFRARRFLTLDITLPQSDGIRSVGLYLMPNPAWSHGAWIYGATIIDQASNAYSARFITDGSNCLIVFVGDATESSIEFQMKPWSRRIRTTGTLPDVAALSNDNDASSACVRQYYVAARAIIDAEHPSTRSDVNRVRRRVAKPLYPHLGSALESPCRARAMAMMNAELDELVSRIAA